MKTKTDKLELWESDKPCLKEPYNRCKNVCPGPCELYDKWFKGKPKEE